MTKKYDLVYCLAPVKDLIDSNVTSRPIGHSIKTPDGQIICLSPSRKLSNIFLSSIDGYRSISRLLEGDYNFERRHREGGFIGNLPREIQELLVNESGEISLRGWSYSSVYLSHDSLGLAKPDEFTQYGPALWVIQGEDEVVAKIALLLNNYDSEFSIRQVAPQEMDSYLRQTKDTPIFETLEELRRRFNKLWYESVIGYLEDKVRSQELAILLEEVAKESGYVRDGDEAKFAKFQETAEKRLKERK